MDKWPGTPTVKPPVHLEQRPDPHDFDWFVYDLVRTARRFGFSLLVQSPEPCRIQDRVAFIGSFQLNLTELRKCWDEVLPGRMSIDEASEVQYCHDHFLLDHSSLNNKTEANARALSDALKLELYDEQLRYKGRSPSRIKQLRDKVEQNAISKTPVTQKIAAELLGCTDRNVRKLLDKGELHRQGKGHVNAQSLLDCIRKRSL